jgi:hypothetical protein
MPNKKFTTGPGLLKIGSGVAPAGGQWEAQVKSVVVEWDVDAEDDEYVLSGETIPSPDIYTATLSGECFQDLTANGMTTYSWAHKGETIAVEFTPNTVEAKKVTGFIKMRPIAIGGDVKQNAISDFEFPFVGEPTLV